MCIRDSDNALEVSEKLSLLAAEKILDNIDDILGTHLTFYDFNNDVIETFVFGRSSSDFSRCYIRLGDKPEVYLVNQNIMFNLQTRPEYWGEKITEEAL